MLVLSRKLDEVITIGEGVEVKVLGVSGNRVKLGISAPVEIPIQRAPDQKSAVPVAREVQRESCLAR